MQFGWLPIACPVSRYTVTLETEPAQSTHTHTPLPQAYRSTAAYLIDSCLCSRDTEYSLRLDSLRVEIVNCLSHNVRHLWVGRTEGHSSLSLGGGGQGVQHLKKGRGRVGLNVQVVGGVRTGASRRDRGCTIDSEVPRLRGRNRSATTGVVLHLILREKLL